MISNFIEEITLSNFRCHKEFSLNIGRDNLLLIGENGSGKTSVIEAISLFSNGRGLKAKNLLEIISSDTNLPNTEFDQVNFQPVEIGQRTAIAFAKINISEQINKIGISINEDGKKIKINGEFKKATELSEFIYPLWLTPLQDGLFTQSTRNRLAYFDRLVAIHENNFSEEIKKFNRLMKQRIQFLLVQDINHKFLDSLEYEMSEIAIFIAISRLEFAKNLAAAPSFQLERGAIILEGDIENALMQGKKQIEIQEEYQNKLFENRFLDKIKKSTSFGPHKVNFQLYNKSLQRLANQCSTGEQKIMLLDLFMANAYFLHKNNNNKKPIFLLDDIGSHLDLRHLNIILELIDLLEFQTIITSTDDKSFADWKNKITYNIVKRTKR